MLKSFFHSSKEEKNPLLVLPQRDGYTIKCTYTWLSQKNLPSFCLAKRQVPLEGLSASYAFLRQDIKIHRKTCIGLHIALAMSYQQVQNTLHFAGQGCCTHCAMSSLSPQTPRLTHSKLAELPDSRTQDVGRGVLHQRKKQTLRLAKLWLPHSGQNQSCSLTILVGQLRYSQLDRLRKLWFPHSQQIQSPGRNCCWSGRRCWHFQLVQ